MPQTEAQNETQPGPAAPTPPERPDPPSRRSGRRDGRAYDGLEPYDLLHVIEDLEDDRSRALLREKIWIALLLHILVFGYIVFGPKYLYHVKVIDPSTRMKEREKEMTFLDLPPDALKQVRPKAPAVVSDKDRVQQAQKPTLDRKTLQQLEAMRRAGPPKPAPAPPTAAQQQAPPTPQPPQVAQQPQPQRPSQPLPPTQTSQLEAPAPKPTQPSFNTGAATAGDAVQQAARQAARGGAYSSGGDMGASAPTAHGGMAGAVDVLSDTLGVDFGPYIQRVIYDTKRAWYPIIPPSAQPPLSKQGRVMIRFKITPDGSVKEMKLEGPSGDVSLDRAAWGGITGASPFLPLPKNFKGPYLELRFYFLYNERPGVE